jgi:hypothetical protein
MMAVTGNGLGGIDFHVLQSGYAIFGEWMENPSEMGYLGGSYEENAGSALDRAILNPFA